MNRSNAVWVREIALVLALVAVSACKTDDSAANTGHFGSGEQPPGAEPVDPPATPDPNSAPLISGSPTENAIVGRLFEFVPQASDADGDELTFYVSSKPPWASFNSTTGRLQGTPKTADVGVHDQIVIQVSDGSAMRALPEFEVKVMRPRKATYGHYFATREVDTPAEAAMLCEQAGVSGVVWRRTWREVEPTAGVYDFDSFDNVLTAIGNSSNPTCQMWIFVEFKSFSTSAIKNPCPTYLQAQYSALNSTGSDAATCFMWEQAVVDAYKAMMRAAAARYDANPRVEGLILQESALGFNGTFSQDVADGGTYTPESWRDALIELVTHCGAVFSESRCMAFLNFIDGGQPYLHQVSAAIAAVPDNRGCFSGPDLLPDNASLFHTANSVYEVLVRHDGCRSNSAQNDSFEVPGCGPACIFDFAVNGSFGDFDQSAPLASGLCVNSYLLWNHRTQISATGLDWTDALPVIAANSFGSNWLDRCADGGAAP